MLESIKSMTESNEIPTFNSICSIVDNYTTNKSELDSVGYTDIKNVESSYIDKIVDCIEKSKEEIITNTYDAVKKFKAEIESVTIDADKVYGLVKTHDFSFSPKYYNIKFKVNELLSIKPINICDVISKIYPNCKCNDLMCMIKSLCGEVVENKFTGKMITENLKIIVNFYETLLTLISDTYSKYLEVVKSSDITDMKNISEYYFGILNVCKAAIIASNIAVIELIGIVKRTNDEKVPLNESVTKENVREYIGQLYDLIGDLRKYYDEFEYKDIIEPRKKHIEKMTEYMLGALERKYTLKIPVYKILNFRDNDNREKILRFIDKLMTITKQYHNFYLITPNMKSDEEDLFIYITLKEPFGEKDDSGERLGSTKDRNAKIAKPEDEVIKESSGLNIEVKTGNSGEKIIYVNGVREITVDPGEVTSAIKEIEEERENKSLNESAMTKEERDKLDYKQFGLPNERKFPIHDEEHIKQALRMFSKCPDENKTTLVRNIVHAIITNKLVGKVTVTKNFKERDRFPEWMYAEANARLVYYKNDKDYSIAYYDNDGIEHKITMR